MKEEQAIELISKYQRGELTPDQEVRLNEWYLVNAAQSKDELTKEQMDATVNLVRSKLPLQEPMQRRLWPRIVTVAAAVALIVLGVYFFNYRNNEILKQVQDDVVVNDIAPGKFGATLTLASGKKIRLSDIANGEIAKEAGISVTKTANGQLVYEIKETTGDPNKINTLSTAKGETYILSLPDKSRVWLNAASSLTYATNLIQNGQRRVKLTGEAYLEVAKDKAHPFVVQTANQEVEVLGTEFNINAYQDDALAKTTLAEGSIKLTAFGKSVVLKPNQQAISGNGTISIKQVDAELALAWKSGFFLFDRESLESIMAKISRWYDVDIVFNDPSLKIETFTGTVSRFDNISQVFKMLELSEVAKFKIESGKITVDKMK